MTENDLRELMPQLEAYHGRFHGFFCRSEGRKWSMKYLQGLMMPIERKNREIKFYLSNAPETVSISEIAWAGCQRWSIEVDFKLAKGEVGLDHYELTKYRGWYHHITLSMLALAFLKAVQRQWGKKMCKGYCS
jgi:SRSO17 transposase